MILVSKRLVVVWVFIWYSLTNDLVCYYGGRSCYMLENVLYHLSVAWNHIWDNWLWIAVVG